MEAEITVQVGVIWPKKLPAGHHYHHLELWTEYVIVVVAESFQVRPQVAQIHHALLLSGPQKHQRPKYSES